MNKLCLLLLALGLAPLAAQDGKPDFAGAWDLQLDKSDFGPLPRPESVTYTVEHKEPKVTLTTRSKTAQGEATSVRNHTTGGEENTNQVQGREWKSKTRWEGNELVTESQYETQQFGKVKLKERWQLSEDRKTLTVARSFASELGEAEQKYVFARQ